MQTLKQSTFIEQMVKRGTKEKDTLKRVIIVMLGLIVLTLPFLISVSVVYYVEPVLILVVAFAVWIFWRRAAEEYEYIYTDGNLDIDVVYGQSTRKHLVTFDTREVSIIAPANDPAAKRYTKEKAQKTIYACRGEITDATYVAVGEYKGKIYHVYFEPEARILKGIRSYSPRTSVIRPEDLIEKEPEYKPSRMEEQDYNSDL